MLNFNFSEEMDVPIVIEQTIDTAVEVVQEPSSKIKVVTPTPSRSNSIRNKSINFRTFHSRGEYTINGPQPLPQTAQENIPMATSDHYDVEAAAQFDEDFPSPPEEFYDAQSSPVQILAVRQFDEEFQEPPPTSSFHD
jgi:hypothetical protein